MRKVVTCAVSDRDEPGAFLTAAGSTSRNWRRPVLDIVAQRQAERCTVLWIEYALDSWAFGVVRVMLADFDKVLTHNSRQRLYAHESDFQSSQPSWTCAAMTHLVLECSHRAVEGVLTSRVCAIVWVIASPCSSHCSVLRRKYSHNSARGVFHYFHTSASDQTFQAENKSQINSKIICYLTSFFRLFNITNITSVYA